MTKILSDILYKCPVREIIGEVSRPIKNLHFDSRLCEAGDVFVAIKGNKSDGHDFIEQVIKKGVAAVVCEKLPQRTDEKVVYVKVENAAYTLALAAGNYYDNPSQKLQLVGVTGTNGKTTIASLLYTLFTDLGFACGLFSTIENKINGSVLPASHTTPDPLQINALMSRMVAEGCQYAFMEVSSHAVVQFRVAGLKFTGGIFTNLTHDHLDYHGDFQSYRDAKKAFFDWLPKTAFALINTDDKNGQFMIQNTKAASYSYSLSKAADYRAKILENSFEGLLLLLDGEEVSTHLVGKFNAYNLLAIYATSRLLGIEKAEALQSLSKLHSATGRFDLIYHPAGIMGIVDYAHTPDALDNVLKTINDIRTNNEQLITVVGAGGDRDKTKRPEMARLAAAGSTKLILTSDNPRTENPETIIQDMRKGVAAEHFNRVLAVSNRREAIRTAVALASKGDIILVAGKGHETYQEINGIRQPFDDRKELQEALNERLK
ncbi:MAG TPA: UDP-N-acetylmuramoyl-L-alanyl-D-glutamate--2,6-diaminopimelate ligase [Bacteroidales bacterium]|jgi:UDP-N-acetylmuramoyl-L-alanyl-D-glutamate--2,6-diaminopimelate ligase|nr:UDP-N-acetylmuramoyl-L-alanyl-D-glutamate--2,6-diaminopimelate ligase [Bacteroidales bacterium]MDY0085238.1 UDP-N-acetylmuramoyl-L-alanyl-D-glutamate--2,6-diaminopimelate ligase [Bacteroidales bacterium]HPE42922.1 UDP-N-acetylmuramoyl-L-alanyl-D-glutamate--2,6-diaminopimelate ligase [Bacteroidales bacterium]